MPALTEERRRSSPRSCTRKAEAAKIAVRNVRRDANEHLKKLLKDKQCSEDDERHAHDDVQKLTDRFIAEIDKLLHVEGSRPDGDLTPSADAGRRHDAHVHELHPRRSRSRARSRVTSRSSWTATAAGRSKRLLPRVAGHRKGVEAVRATVRASIERGIEYLTLFAFSSENWRRPADEVSILMELFAARARAGSRKAARQRHPLQGRRRHVALRPAHSRARRARARR